MTKNEERRTKDEGRSDYDYDHDDDHDYERVIKNN